MVAPWYEFGDVVPHLHADMGAYQFHRLAPEGVMFIAAHWSLREYSAAAVEEGTAQLMGSLRALGRRGVDRLNVGGVPVAAVMTRPRALALLSRAQDETGMPCTNSFEAYVDAMRAFGVDKVALATRWSEALNDAVVDYLAAAEIEVVSRAYVDRSLAVNKVASPEEDRQLLIELGRDAFARGGSAQGIMLPGGLGFVVQSATALEEELGIVSFTNATTMIWSCLSDYPGDLPSRPRRGWGRLLDSLAA